MRDGTNRIENRTNKGVLIKSIRKLTVFILVVYFLYLLFDVYQQRCMVYLNTAIKLQISVRYKIMGGKWSIATHVVRNYEFYNSNFKDIN